jgi:hypothetical protein
MLNDLEEAVQRQAFDDMTKIGPMIDGIIGKAEFSRKSEHWNPAKVEAPETPELDKAAKKAITMMDELEQMAASERANKYLDKIRPAIDFAEDDCIVALDSASVPTRFDLPTLGNPLELGADDIIGWVKEIV